MGSEISSFSPDISASEARFKNCLGDPEGIPLMGSQLKNELIWPSRLGGGAIDFERSSSYNSGLL